MKGPILLRSHFDCDAKRSRLIAVCSKMRPAPPVLLTVGLTAVCLFGPAPDASGQIHLGHPSWEPVPTNADRIAPPAYDGDAGGRQGIEITDLNALSVDAIGLLMTRDGGLGMDAWRGLSFQQASDLLDTLPAGVFSPSMGVLARRVLLSTATPPTGTEGEPGVFFTKRAQRLFQMGFVGDLQALLNRLPADTQPSPALDRLIFESRAVQGRGADACRTPPTTDQDARFLRRVQLYCKVQAGDVLSLTKDVAELKKDWGENDPFVIALQHRVYLVSGLLPADFYPDPLSAALLRDEQNAFNIAHLTGKPPWLLAMIAEAPAQPMSVRREAAAMCVALGVISERSFKDRFDSPSGVATALGDSMRTPRVPPPNSPALMTRLDKAVQDQCRAETALLSLALLGAVGGPTEAPDGFVGAVTDALERVGLRADSRAIAREAGLRSVLP